MSYIVKVPLVIAKSVRGDQYLYEGATVPSDLGDDEIGRLIDGDYVVEVQDVEPEPDESTKEPTPLAEMNHDELVAYAAENGVDIGKATSDDTIRAKIVEAEQA